jgi:hypothetical protein
MSLVKDAGLEKFHELLGCRLKQSKDILRKTVENAMNTSVIAYKMRESAIQKLSHIVQNDGEEIENILTEVHGIEATMENFLNPKSEDLQKLQEDALSQLSFQDNYFKCLNYTPYVLLVLSLFKVWIVPSMAIFIPVIAWMIPYIFLKFLYKFPISAEQYGDIMKLLWSGSEISFEKTLNGVKPVQPMSLFTPRSILQSIFMILSFAQSLVQPIQNAYHLYKIDMNVVENGNRVVRLKKLYDDIQRRFISLRILFPFRRSLRILDEDPRRALHLLIEQPERFQIALRDFAEIEILWRIATSPDLSKSELILNGDVPVIHALNIHDISLNSTAVPSTVSFTGVSHHAILTGPNGGGKSSFLRALLQCVLLSHSYGVAPAEKFIIRKISWISSGLRLQDLPGTLSMFESEVYFASKILQRRKEEGFGFVIYDELFHSTNPPDGILTAKNFLEELWKKESVLSIVSTHVFELVENAPETVQKVCCNALAGKGGTIQFLYDVQPGICKVSSVKSIWNRFELFPVAGKSPPKKQSL